GDHREVQGDLATVGVADGVNDVVFHPRFVGDLRNGEVRVCRVLGEVVGGDEGGNVGGGQAVDHPRRPAVSVGQFDFIGDVTVGCGGHGRFLSGLEVERAVKLGFDRASGRYGDGPWAESLAVED